MKLIVGLGNPGRDYDGTRHNAGFEVVDRLIARHAPGEPMRSRFHGAGVEARVSASGGGAKALLLKPTTFMNRSGVCVGEAVRFYKLNPATDLLVVYDEVDLDTGVVKLKPSGGTGGHNGLKDIHRVLGTDAYPRLRVGIASIHGAPGRRTGHVLGRFNEQERALIDPALDKAADAVETFCVEGVDAAMNRFNAEGGSGWSKKPPEGTVPEGMDPGWLGG
ncbi:MAG: aminoacyl-tRNA hydrolase [Planctomycetota bacterium]